MTRLLFCMLAWSSLLAWPGDARACGGCFAPPTETSTVTGHRMAFAVSAERTVLWDQFEYDGSPQDFSWVLPVAPGAYLEEASDAWFEALEGLTSTRVTGPRVACATSGSGGGCVIGGAASDDSASGAFFDEGVLVLHRETIGPYQTVTLRSTDGDALTTWLTTNGYSIPTDIEPVIGAYVSEGADFIALRLSPGQGVQQMTPVRVVTPGAEPILPLRMVAAGTGPFVDIVLYVIGEGRFVMPDLQGMQIDPKLLTWDYAAGTSDYVQVRAAALEQHQGRSYLTTFAFQAPFAHTFTDPNGIPVSYPLTDDFRFANAVDFVDSYFGRVAIMAGRDPAFACEAARASLSGSAVVNEASSESFVCEGGADLAAAMIGMRPSEVWLTRLEMRLPREALDIDCAVELAAEQLPVSNELLTGKTTNRDAIPNCPAPIFTSRIARGGAVTLEGWVIAAAVGAWFGRKQWRRGRPRP